MLSFRAATTLLVVWLVLPIGLFAQLNIERTERLAVEQGLPDQDIRDIHCDARGFLWLATSLEMNRFDGYRFESYSSRSAGTQRLHGRNIAQIGESADGWLYISYVNNFKCIDLFHTDQLRCTQVFLHPDNGLEGLVQDIYMEKRGSLFALSVLPGALAIWRLNAGKRFEKVDSLPWEGAKSEHLQLLKSKAGGFWIHSSRQGLFYLSGEGKVVQHIENKGFKNKSVANSKTELATGDSLMPAIFQEDGRGRFWLSFKNLPGVYLFEKAKESQTVVQPWTGFAQQEYVTRLWEDDLGNLLFASPNPKDKYTFSKLLGLRPNGEQFDGSPLLQVENKIQDIVGQDFERQAFLATYSGMYKVFLRNNGIHQYLARTLKPGEFGAIVRGIVGDGQGHIFFALEERHWYCLNTRTDQIDTLVLTDARGFPLELTCSGAALAYDPAGYVWGMGCAKEEHYNLYRYKLADKTTRIWPLEGLLTTFYRQPDGRFCLLFRNRDKGGYISLFDPLTENYTVYANQDGSNPFAERMPKYVLASRLRPNLLWIGTTDGVVGVDMQRRISATYGTSISIAALNFSQPNVLAIQEDETGTLWVGTGGGGLNMLSFEKPDPDTGLPRPAAVKIIDDAQGLSNNIVCGILPDGQGGHLLSTYYGLNFCNQAGQVVGNFYKHDGLTHNEFNRFSFFRDENKRYYFGTINGLNAFYLPDLLGKKTSDNIQLTKLTKYYGQTGQLEEQMIGLNGLRELVIEPEVSYFQLEFMLTDYAQPEKNHFSVWLEGQEKDWNALGSAHTLRYNRLPAGQYMLHLRGVDAGGNWTETPFSIRIESKEFFYHTWWFWSLVALALMGMAWVIFRWRIRSIRAEEQKRTTLNARLAELEVRALQAQMNPHFIFNCLNSIQNFIAEGDKANAMRYVARFAQLTRAVLQFSGKTTIGLDEEIAALEHYLALESLRTGQRVQYHLEIAPDIDTFDTELPPMLVQPFVENSFKHGNISRLELMFRKTDGQLIVTVQDDGIGLTGKTGQLHQSKGIAMTRERLAFWNGRSDPSDLRIDPLEKGLLVTMTIQLK